MKFPLLLDIYGVLLGDRKRELVEYYYNDDYSLAEISEITGISRQGVRDSVKKSEEEIYSLEEKLGIAEKNGRIAALVSSIASDLQDLPKDKADLIADKLESIRSLVTSEDNS